MNIPYAEVHVPPYRTELSTNFAGASGPVIFAETQHALRLAATTADANATNALNLSLLWLDLTRGTSRVVDAFFSEERCYLVLGLKLDGRPIKGQRLEILEALLAGLRQKNIAIEMKIAPSTVTLQCTRVLTSLGVDCKPSRAHPLLMLAARAFNQGVPLLARCSTFVGQDDHELRVISVPRSDRRLVDVLPSAELAVVRWLVEGLTHQAIALKRGTTVRTVANQIGAVFRRLKVSGRNELVQLLFFEEGSSSQTPAHSRQTLIPQPISDSAVPATPDRARRSA